MIDTKGKVSKQQYSKVYGIKQKRKCLFVNEYWGLSE